MSTGMSLLKVLCRQGARQLFRQLVPEHFIAEEQPCYQFVNTYYRQHGQLPTFEALSDNGFPMLAYRDNEAASYYLERMAGRYVILTTRNAMTDLNHALMANDGISTRNIITALAAAIRGTTTGSPVISLAQSIDDVIERYERARLNPGIQGITFGYPWLDNVTGGMQNGDLISMAGRTGMGKAQPLDAKVLTPMGWRSMGSLCVGDRLASTDGTASVVVAIHPQGSKTIYRVVFSDGASAECCADHLWRVHCAHWPERWRVLDTTKLIHLLDDDRYCNLLSIETFNGYFGVHALLPLDPYLMGQCLGDNGLTRSVKTTPAEDFIEVGVGASLPPFQDPQHKSSSPYGSEITCLTDRGPPTRGKSEINESLRAPMQRERLGRKPTAGFIPGAYLSASREQRLELLRGILDANGWVHGGTPMVAFSSERLADDVWRLGRSLGCTVKRFFKKTACEDSHILALDHSDPASLFSLPRKIAQCCRTRPARSRIRSIEISREAEAQCITISHPSRLYVTDDFVVTHNSYFLNHIAMAAWINGASVLLVSNEMTAVQTTTRFIGQYTGISPERIRRGALDHWQQRTFYAETDAMKHGAPFTIVDGSFNLEVDDVDTFVQEFSPDLVAIDASYLMRAKVQFKNQQGHERQREMSKDIKRVALSRNKPVIQTVQLSAEAKKKTREELDAGMIGGTIGTSQDSTTVLIITEGQSPREHTRRDIVVAKNREGRKTWMRTNFLFDPVNLDMVANEDTPEAEDQGQYGDFAP